MKSAQAKQSIPSAPAPKDGLAQSAETSPQPATAQNTVLERVRSRGRLTCGINGDLPGFSARASNGEWRGFEVDFCRALAAAVVGEADKVDYLPLTTENRFAALREGRIDVLSRNTTWTLMREAEFGVEFAGVTYYDGQGFIVKQDLGLVSAQQLAGLKICVLASTTSETNARFYFSRIKEDVKLQTYPDRAQMIRAYREGSCDAYTADRSALFADRTTFEDPQAHMIMPEVISREPLGPLVNAGDPQWARIVRWVLAGLVNAEEEALSRQGFKTKAAFSQSGQRFLDGATRAGPLIGLRKDWLTQVITQVGNYGDVFEENLGASGPLNMERGVNALWRQGGILYAPPVW